MISLYDHQLITSFICWFDYTLSTKGQAFYNKNTLIYPIPTDEFASRYVYAAPFKPWIGDNSIPGAQIPTGVYDANGNFLTRASGITFNWDEGWVMSNTPLAAPLSGNYAQKEFNIFYTNEDEDTFINETRFVSMPKTYQQLTGLNANTKTIPLAAVKFDPGKNEPWAFGGTQNTLSEFRVLVITDNNFEIDGILSIFRDTSKSNFCLLDPQLFPYNELGDYKQPANPYNYVSCVSNDPSKYVYINTVNSLKLSDKAGVDVGQKAYVAMIDFEVELPRNFKLTYPPGAGVICDGGTF